MNTLEILIAIWSAVLTFVATYVVVKQYQLEKTKMKFEHFERRYGIYKKVMDYIASVVREATTTSQEMMEFKKETIDVMIFFGDDISEYVSDIYKNANRLRFLFELVSRGNLEYEAHINCVNEESNLMTWFGDQFIQCQALFLNYLRIDVNVFGNSTRKR